MVLTGCGTSLTMYNPTGRPILVSPLVTYREYFVRDKTDTFCGHSSSVLLPYRIDTANAAATVVPKEFTWEIHTVEQEGVLNALFKWQRSAGGGGDHIFMLHSVSIYASYMGITLSPWYDISFASKGEVTCSTAGCANWITTILHHIGAVLYILASQAIYAAMASDPDMDLMGPFTAYNAYVNSILFINKIYLPLPYMGIFLERNIAPVKAWSRLQGAIVDAGAEVDCQPIIGWLRVAFMLNSGDDQPSPLAMPQPTTQLMDGNMIRHRHHILICHHPRRDPALQRVQGLLVSTHIGEVDVELRDDREDKAQFRERSDRKLLPEFQGGGA